MSGCFHLLFFKYILDSGALSRANSIICRAVFLSFCNGATKRGVMDGRKDRRKDGKTTTKACSCFFCFLFVVVSFLVSLLAYLGSFFYPLPSAFHLFLLFSSLLKLKLALYFLVCLVCLCILKGEGEEKEGKKGKKSKTLR